MRVKKRVEDLSLEDVQRSRVWEYCNVDEDGETLVRPVLRIPVKSLTGRLAACEVTLANGRSLWALIGNLDLSNAALNEHFATLSVLKDGSWFHLARYHDIEAEKFGPEVLARFLELAPTDVFPIRYDLSSVALGGRDVVHGSFQQRPTKRLSRAEIIALAVP